MKGQNMTDVIRTGPGKSNTMNFPVAELAPGAIRTGHYTGGNPATRRSIRDLTNSLASGKVWLILGREPNKNILKGADWVVTDVPGTLTMLQAAVNIIDSRRTPPQDPHGQVPLGQQPWLTLCVDEGAELLTAPGMPDYAASMIRYIIQEGSRVRVRTVYRSQDDRRIIHEYAGQAEVAP